jgi:hypothetical protein
MSVENLIRATDTEIPEIVALMNQAYRGSGATSGWSTETDYIDGDRTTETLLRQDIAATPHARLLLWRRASGDLQG